MTWFAIAGLVVVVMALWVRLGAVQRSLTEARAVLMSLPEVEHRLIAVQARRTADREELARHDAERARLTGS